MKVGPGLLSILVADDMSPLLVVTYEYLSNLENTPTIARYFVIAREIPVDELITPKYL